MSPPVRPSNDAIGEALRALVKEGTVPLPLAVAYMTDIGKMLRQVESAERKRITGVLRNRAIALRDDPAQFPEAILIDALIDAWDPWGSGLQP